MSLRSGSDEARVVKDVKSTNPLPAYLSDIESEASSETNESALLRKLDLKLLPAVGVLYLLSFLDRSNVANAKLEGLTDDLGITGNQYLTSLTLFFLGYVLFEIPCNIVLKRTSPKFWLPTLTLAWGIVSTLQGITQNLAGYFIVRFLLGLTESGLFPGVVYYLSMWYKRNERQYRVALFFSAASLAGAFGGILAYGIAYMRGVAGQSGWRWIFIIEGCFTCVVACLAYFFIANYPVSAPFLTEKEKALVQDRLLADSDSTHDERFTWAAVLNAFKDPKCWLYGIGFHTMSLPLYTLSLFLPTIIKDLGYSAANAQLLTIPPYALATMLTVGVAIVSERAKTRAPFIMATSTLGIVGYIILLSNRELQGLHIARPGVSYVGTFFAAAGIYPSTALVLSWPAVNVSGQTKRAIANAMQISIGNLGAILGTQLYRPIMSPHYVVGHSFAMAYLFGNVCIVGALWHILRKENKRRESQGGALLDLKNVDPSSWKGDEDVRWKFST